MMTDTLISRDDMLLEINPDNGIMNIRLGPAALAGRTQAQITTTDKRPCTLIGEKIETLSQKTITNVHGTGRQLSAHFAPHPSGLALILESAIYEAHPFIALRVGLINNNDQTVNVHRLSPLTTTDLHLGAGPLDGWVNGYHSWSYTGHVPHNRRQPRTALGFLTWPYGHNSTTSLPREAGRYVGEEVAALVDGDRQALVAGFIGLVDQFGQVYADGRPGHQALTLQTTADGVPLDPGETLWGEWAVLYYLKLPHPDPLGIYAEAVTRLTPGRVSATAPLPGWSSWYQFFDKVTAEDMARNQRALCEWRDRLPLHLIQLDDGYQPAWGDWLEHNTKFPQGVPGWADSVRADGFEPGLWLSPFTIDRWARLYREHPEAILRDARGKPVRGGIRIDRALHWLYGLDLTHPVTQDHVRRSIETIVHEWNIRYLKLDFLYCGALPGHRYNPKRTRAQALRDGLKLIRETAGEEVKIVGCGCPLGPAIGLVDIMRVGEDVAPHWRPKLFGLERPFRDDPHMPSARNSIGNSIRRMWTHRRFWWLDADNLMVREQQELTPAEVQSLVATIALTGSHLMTSDDLPSLSEERLCWAASLLPLIQGKGEVPTLLSDPMPDTVIQRLSGPVGSWVVAGLFNWEDHPAERTVPLTELGIPTDSPALLCDFWGHRVSLVQNILHTGMMPPHGVALYALRPVVAGPQLAGSDLHISMGGEISGWQIDNSGLHCTLSLGRKASGTLWLKLPQAVNSAVCNGQAISVIPLETQGLYAVSVSLSGEAQIDIKWE
jgi:alpha-galactosidase